MNSSKPRMIGWLALVLMASITHVTHARAEKTGNGGGAWVCREINGTIRWSELVDLFEAKNEFGLTLTPYSGSVGEIVELASLKILNANRPLYEALAPFIRKLNYLKPNPPKVTFSEDVLEVVDDSLYRLVPTPDLCLGGKVVYEQVANFKHDGYVLLQSEIYNSFSNSMKAALVLHEAIYAYRRKMANDSNSVNTRRIVGLAFSTASPAELRKFVETIGEGEIDPIKMEFVSIPPGDFLMGSPISDPRHGWAEEQHRVYITRGYEMQAVTVTQVQWVKLMGSNPSEFQEREHCPTTFRILRNIPMCPNHPIESVFWDEIQEFISRLNSVADDGYHYRLPTEAEWEYAERAGTQTSYPFGDDPSLLDLYSFYTHNSGGHTHEVGQLQPNPWGLYDMYGNVHNWVQDYFGRFSSETVYDPIGPSNGYDRSLRGASWVSPPSHARAASRWGSQPRTYRNRENGFRLVRTR
jgi:formylglycine-generating enzyme required for sulfatase activity